MKTVDEIRRENLVILANEYQTAGALADLLEISSSQLSQWKSASKHSATGKPRRMSSDSARHIEEKCGKPYGWMDMCHSPDYVENAERIFQEVDWQFHRNESNYGNKIKEESIQLGRLTLVPDFFIWSGDKGFFVDIKENLQSSQREAEFISLQDQGRLLLVDSQALDSIPELIKDFESKHPILPESCRIPYFASKESASKTPSKLIPHDIQAVIKLMEGTDDKGRRKIRDAAEETLAEYDAHLRRIGVKITKFVETNAFAEPLPIKIEHDSN